MKAMRRTMVASVVASACVAAGCSAAEFATVNQAFVTVKQTASTATSVVLPAAAIAASLGAVQLISSLAASSQTASQSPALYQLAGLTAKDLDITNVDSKVDMHASFTSSMGADGSVSSAVTSFTGTTQGYTANAAGAFTYTPGSGSSTVTCDMTGSLVYGDTTFTVKKLAVSTTFPLPTANAQLGSCIFQQLDGTTLKSELIATLAIDASGDVITSGTLTQNGKTTTMANFGKNSVAAAAL